MAHAVDDNSRSVKYHETQYEWERLALSQSMEQRVRERVRLGSEVKRQGRPSCYGLTISSMIPLIHSLLYCITEDTYTIQRDSASLKVETTWRPRKADFCL